MTLPLGAYNLMDSVVCFPTFVESAKFNHSGRAFETAVILNTSIVVVIGATVLQQPGYTRYGTSNHCVVSLLTTTGQLLHTRLGVNNLNATFKPITT